MKFNRVLLSGLVMVCVCAFAFAAENAAEKKEPAKEPQKIEKKAEKTAEKAEKKAAKKDTKKEEKKKLRHVVVLKFKEGTTQPQIDEVVKAFKALKTKIKVINSLEWGTNVSKENLNQGFTHCFVLTFNSEADRDAYIAHTDHKAFGQVFGPVSGGVFVIDFWAEK